jgi:hypothetical protein
MSRPRSQRAGDQVEQRGLAGAIRPDQRVARTLRQPEVDAVGYAQRAEALAQAERLQRCGCACPLKSVWRRARASRDARPVLAS